jgi:hypothetical protein
LTTPGISPLDASSLKHILQSWKRLIKPRGLPQSLHRLYFLALNFAGLAAFTINDVFAILSFQLSAVNRQLLIADDC